MPVELELTVDDNPVRKYLERARQRSGDLEPVFREWDREWNQFFRTRFFTAARRFGGPWKELEPETKRARRRSQGGNQGGVDRPLWDTGGLRKSFVESNNPNAVRVIDEQKYERGSRLPRAFYHQTGSGVPQRRIVPEEMPEFLIDRLKGLISEHITEE